MKSKTFFKVIDIDGVKRELVDAKTKEEAIETAYRVCDEPRILEVKEVLLNGETLYTYRVEIKGE